MANQPPKSSNSREKNMMVLGYIFMLPIIFVGCNALFSGSGQPKPSVLQQMKYDECMKEKQETFNKGWIEADSICAFWKTADIN